MDNTVTINEINFDHHPAPWRMEDAPKGWGDSTVVFDANNECVHRELYPLKSKRETWENIIRLVNQIQSPGRMGSDNPYREPMSNIKNKMRWYLSWLIVRPRRWFFRQQIHNSRLRLLPKNDRFFGWQWPNLHWYLLYKTVFNFCHWLNGEAWRYFCTWENGWIKTKPLIARIIHRIGQTTAGFQISGGECFHCGSVKGDQVDLSIEENEYFELLDTWSVGTPDGTDYRFKGITTCPDCGYKQEYEDGSL